MLSYCLKCKKKKKKKKKNAENINPRASKSSNGKTVLLSKCVISGSKNLLKDLLKNKEEVDYWAV